MTLKILEVTVVFFLVMNLWSGVLIGTGAASDIGLDGKLTTGGGEDVENAQDATNKIDTGAPTGQTLFGLYNVLAGTLGQIRQVAFGGPAMLYNLGVPGALTGMAEVLVGFVYAFAIIKFLRGI
jgi:hypothetical protein